MSFFVESTTTEHVVKSPDGAEATVELRELNAGDIAAIQDTVRMSVGDNESPELKIGAFRLAMVERALVKWSLDVGVSPNSIRQLEPSVFEQIFALVNDDGGAEGNVEGKS